jgi:rhamnosyltransferase subunit B
VFDGGYESEIPGVLTTPGAPIVVFTAGTARDAAADFFQAALEASHDRAWRPVLLTAGYEPQTVRGDKKISPHAFIFDYLPLTQLLPLSALVVHHGGLGTLSLAARSATPQLVVPFGHDQFDNAARIERLGIGRSVKRGAGLSKRLGVAIEAMLSEPKYATRCKGLAPWAGGDEALERICSQIESDEGRSIPLGADAGDSQAV